MEGGEAVVHSRALSYFSRMAGVREFEEAVTLEIHRRGIEKAGVVCAVNDGAAWCQSFVDYPREDAIRNPTPLSIWEVQDGQCLARRA